MKYIIDQIKNIRRKKEFWGLLLSVPQTIVFNFRYLSFKQAIKLPIWIYFRSKFSCYRGGVKLPSQVWPAMIRIGFSVDYSKSFSDMTLFRVEKEGQCIFEGSAHLGRGTKIAVHKGADLILGDNFAISASSTIKCFKHIKMGKDILFAWDCLVMDSDGHQIFDEDGKLLNPNMEIIFGDKIWLGCGVTVLKGSNIPDNCVIGANTMIAGGKFSPNSIITGNPPQSRKKIIKWVK